MKERHFLSKNVFWGNAVGYLRNSKCESFQTFAIVFSTPENLLGGITGDLGTQECHILSWNMFSGNAVEYLRNSKCWELSNLCHCVQHPWKLTGRDYWSSRNKRKPLSKLKHVFRKCSGVSQQQWVLKLSNLAIVFSTPENITSRDFWSYRNERKLTFWAKCVLRKCCRVSQKWWMLEQYASHLCSGTAGVPLTKVDSSAKFVYWYSWHLYSGTGGSID